eukprot:gene25224-32914_t
MMSRTGYYWLLSNNSNCGETYEEWNLKKFSSILSGHNIMIVGDSMNELFGVTLCFALNLSSIAYKVQRQGHDFTLSINRNDWFLLNNKNNEETDNKLNVRNYPFYEEFFKKRNISILIFNRGAHYKDDVSLITEINQTLTFLFEKHPSVAVIYRNTAAAHTNVGNHLFSDPLDEPPSISLPTHYHWDQFKHQNELVENFLRQNFPSVLRLDIYSPTVLRNDMHADALHYCVPGPIDEWVFRSNAMRSMENMKGGEIDNWRFDLVRLAGKPDQVEPPIVYFTALHILHTPHSIGSELQN